MELRFLSKVAGKIQPYIMVISLIGAAGHIFNSLQRLVIQNRHILIQLIRSDKSSYQDAVILDIRRMDMIADKVRDLRLICLHISAHEDYDKAVVTVLLVNNRLACIFNRKVQCLCNVFDGAQVRCINFLQFRHRSVISGIVHQVLCRFHVCLIITAVTDSDGILSDRCQKHIFMRNASSHHTGIRFYRNHIRNTGSRKNTMVRIVADLIVTLQIFL